MDYCENSDIKLLMDGYYTITALKPSFIDEDKNHKLQEGLNNGNWLLFPYSYI